MGGARDLAERVRVGGRQESAADGDSCENSRVRGVCKRALSWAAASLSSTLSLTHTLPGRAQAQALAADARRTRGEPAKHLTAHSLKKARSHQSSTENQPLKIGTEKRCVCHHAVMNAGLKRSAKLSCTLHRSDTARQQRASLRCFPPEQGS
eukprot:6178481-Pleurochrysis_carterae.AAC.2